jgi:hypothetical protein
MGTDVDIGCFIVGLKLTIVANVTLLSFLEFFVALKRAVVA